MLYHDLCNNELTLICHLYLLYMRKRPSCPQKYGIDCNSGASLLRLGIVQCEFRNSNNAQIAFVKEFTS
jgi:hypothetical protein